MNYYERHLGDYAKDTGHLSMLEHGAYNLLLDRYYSSEQGIPEDQVYRVTRAVTKDERAAVDAVLHEFFKLKKRVWIKNRVEEEITRYKESVPAQEEKRENDKERQRRARERRKQLFDELAKYGIVMPWNTKTKSLEERLSVVRSQQCHAPVTRDNTAIHNPDTRHQTPITTSEFSGDDDDGTPNARRIAVDQWPYPEAVLRDLEFLHGVDRGFAELELQEFRAYWRAKLALLPGEWDSKFLQRCRDQWDRRLRGDAR